MSTLKLYTCTNAKGVWLSAVCIVFAANEEEARDLLFAELQRDGIKESSRDDLELVVSKIRTGAHILWDGDY